MQTWLKSIDIDMRSKVRLEGLNFLWPVRWWWGSRVWRIRQVKCGLPPVFSQNPKTSTIGRLAIPKSHFHLGRLHPPPWSWLEWDISRQLSKDEWWDGKLLTGRKIILEVTSIHLSLPYLCCSGMFSSERSIHHEWDQLAVVRSVSVKLSTLAEKNRRINSTVFGSFQRSGKSVFLFSSFRAGSRRREDDKRSCSLLTVNVTEV